MVQKGRILEKLIAIYVTGVLMCTAAAVIGTYHCKKTKNIIAQFNNTS